MTGSRAAAVRSRARRLQRGAVKASMWVTPPGASGPRVLVTSLPKSGTHLISAVLSEFPDLAKYPGNRIDPPPPWSWLPGGAERITLGVGHPRTVDRARLRRFLGALRPGLFLTGHVPHSDELAEDLVELDYRVIAMVRDPRDVVVSKVRFANSTPDGRLDRELLKHESPERQVALATEGYAIGEGGEAIHIGARLAKILAWGRAGALTVRFEDLVGPRGGGSEEAQLDTIRAIRAHLGLADDAAAVETAAANSFGRSPTFRSGRSSGWRQHLSAEQAARVEDLAGDAMRRLGYLPIDPAGPADQVERAGGGDQAGAPGGSAGAGPGDQARG